MADRSHTPNRRGVLRLLVTALCAGAGMSGGNAAGSGTEPSADPWAIHPCQGLGPLRFGMTPGEIAAYDAIYGPPERRAGTDGAGGDPVDIETEVDETLALLAEAMPPEELAAMRDDLTAALRTSRAHEARTATEVRVPSGLTLDYLDGRLRTIHAASDAARLHLDGVAVFDTELVDLVRHLRERAGEGAFLRGTTPFEPLGLVLVDFVHKGLPLRALDEPEARVVSLSPDFDDLDLSGARPLDQP